MREELLRAIFDSDKQVMLVDLPIISGVKNNMFELFKIQDSILNYLDSITDFEVAAVIQKIDEFALNIDAMAMNAAILYHDDLNKLFQDMKTRMKKNYSKNE